MIDLYAFRDVDYVVHASYETSSSIEYNPTECIKTNIDGAKNMNAAINQNVKGDSSFNWQSC